MMSGQITNLHGWARREPLVKDCARLKVAQSSGPRSKVIVAPGQSRYRGRFLTTSPNAMIEPIHEKAMPVILTNDEERETCGYEPRGMRRRRCRMVR